MTIVETYKFKQEDPQWVKRYLSIGRGNYGKTYSYYNTNFRGLLSFYHHINEFRVNNGVPRSQWHTADSGQEYDKTRVVNLRNADFIISADNGETYFFTEKGNEALSVNDDTSYSDREKWVLLLLLLLDFKAADCSHDFVMTTFRTYHNFTNVGLDGFSLIGKLKEACSTDKKVSLFSKDVFWYLTFANDYQFISEYFSSNNANKQELFDWVIYKAEDKNSRDLIARKFVSGGVYTASAFVDDINVFLSILIIFALQASTCMEYISLACQLYNSCRKDVLLKRCNDHKAIYQHVYDRAVNSINKRILLQKEN